MSTNMTYEQLTAHYKWAIERNRERAVRCLRQLASDLRRMADDVQRHADRAALEESSNQDVVNQVQWALNAYRSTSHSSVTEAESAAFALIEATAGARGFADGFEFGQADADAAHEAG